MAPADAIAAANAAALDASPVAGERLAPSTELLGERLAPSTSDNPARGVGSSGIVYGGWVGVLVPLGVSGVSGGVFGGVGGVEGSR